jgi:hypothetical protein
MNHSNIPIGEECLGCGNVRNWCDCVSAPDNYEDPEPLEYYPE